MGKLYNSVPEAIAAGTACNFQLPFVLLPPLPPFPPPIPFPDLGLDLPSVPVYCPLD
jgi:hypothetical protein